MHENKKELIVYRMARAKEKLNSSKLLLDNGNYKDFILSGAWLHRKAGGRML